MAKPSKAKTGRGKLFPRHRKFALAYVANGFRGIDAAIEVGFAKTNARFQASRLLADANISQLIKDLADEKFSSLEMRAKETIARVSSIARLDYRKFHDSDDRPIRIADLDEDVARAVQSVEYDDASGKVKKIRVESRLPALAILARYHRLVDDGPPASAVVVKDGEDDLEAARRVAFMLLRASAQTVDVKEISNAENPS